MVIVLIMIDILSIEDILLYLWINTYISHAVELVLLSALDAIYVRKFKTKTIARGYQIENALISYRRYWHKIDDMCDCFYDLQTDEFYFIAF